VQGGDGGEASPQPEEAGACEAGACEACEEQLAVVYCANCEARLCEQCDREEHTSKLSKRHKRAPL
jgi:hypothetical protein